MKLCQQLCVVANKAALHKQHYPKRTLPLDVALLEKEPQLWDLWIPLAVQPEI